MAAPSTIIRSGDGTSVVAYTLPAGLYQYIESVLVEVDNTAGADIRPTLRVKSDAGQVIATKRQGEAIPAGDTGTATWALRLTDEGGLLASSGASARCDFFSQHLITAGQNWTWEWVVSTGNAALLDLTDPFVPVVKVSGIYAISATMIGTVRTPGQTGAITLDADFNFTPPPPPPTLEAFFAEQDFSLQGQPNAPATHNPAGTVAAVWYLTKGSKIDSFGWHSNAADRTFRFFAYVQRIT